MINIIIFTIQAVYLLLMLKILICRFKIKIVDFLVILFLGIGGGLSFPYIGIFTSVIIVVTLGCYIYKTEKYTIEKSIFLSTLTMIIAILLDHVASMLLSLTFGETLFENDNLIFYHLTLSSLLAVLFTLIFTKATKNLRFKINENKKLQIVLASCMTIILFAFYGSIMLSTYLGNDIELIQLNLLFLIIYLIVGIIVFYFYSKTLHEKYEIQRDKDEQKIIQQYTKEIERQFKEVRKFKHDTQNVLSSLDSFINDNDFEGLKEYYSDKIKPTTKLTLKNNFRLEQLSNIKVSEVKSIFAVKLMMAQERDIDATFEAREVISEIPIDSIVLVRTLGILFDNAIEELVELKDGKLLTAILKDKSETIIIIQNTCRNNMPKVHELKQVGFSTKGVKRGLGLSNLVEFTKQNPNMSIVTQIKDNQFIQKVIIREIIS